MVLERTGGAGGGRLRGPGIPLLPPGPVRVPPLAGDGADSCGAATVATLAEDSISEGVVLPRRPPLSSIRWEPVVLMLVCFKDTPLFDLNLRGIKESH